MDPSELHLCHQENLALLRVFRMLRLLRIMRAYRMLYVTPSGTIWRELALLVYTMVTLVMVAGGIFHIIEEDVIPTFDQGIYFVVVTITTVGYGDLSPQTVCFVRKSQVHKPA